MNELPKHANVVIIGAGIVGNSVAFHLAKLGWKDMVMIDKGPLPNTGGSTAHASNFIFPVDHSKVMTQLTLDSMVQYKELGVFRESGGIEIARKPERMQELKRRMASAKAWGIEASLVTPEEVKKLFPWINTNAILGGFHSPSVGVVDSLQAGTMMRDKAKEMGALSVFTYTEITGIDITKGKVTGLQTNKGNMTAEYIIICCGVWSPRIAKMAGASMSLTPIVHQMIDVGPISEFEHCSEEIEYPILRDMDTYMYERQVGNNLEIGSYAHRPIIIKPEEIPSIEESKLSPTELPFTENDFDKQYEDAMELIPEMLDKDEVEIQYSINGLISLTPDGEPLLGETPEVKGLWSAAAIWIKEAPGAGRLLAEWMTHDVSEIDSHELDIARFYDHAKTDEYVVSRAEESFNKIYGIVHPSEQWEQTRGIHKSPMYEREKELGAVFFESGGWERPQWYESNNNLLKEFDGQIAYRPNEWDSRWWSPIISAEHLAMRKRVAMFDLSAFSIFDIGGSGALDYIQYLAVNQMDVTIGRSVYTPILNNQAGMKSDLTIVRMGENQFRVITGVTDGPRDKKWFTRHLPEDGSVQLVDQTAEICTIGVWGPRARDIIQSLTNTDMSHKQFKFGWAREINLGDITVWAFRISYVGDLGWEIYFPHAHGQKVWDLISEAGKPHGIVPAGIGVYGTTGRLEKGYRLFGAELEGEYTPIEAGLMRPKVKSQDFIGKDVLVKLREKDPGAIMCTLTVDNHQSSINEPRFMLGGEPILTLQGNRIVDSHSRPSYVTSAGSGPSVGKHILMAYLPPEHAKNGKSLLVEYFGNQYPVTVAVAGNSSLFDPNNERIRS